MRAFSARRIAELGPRVRQAAREMAGAMLARPAFNLVAELSFPLPAYMIFTLIGFPPEDTKLVRQPPGVFLAPARPGQAGRDRRERRPLLELLPGVRRPQNG